MSFTSTTNQEFLANYPPFNLLPEVAIADFAEKLKPIRYRMGQVIVRREQMLVTSVTSAALAGL
jgi:ATP-binding cassette subfamily B protein